MHLEGGGGPCAAPKQEGRGHFGPDPSPGRKRSLPSLRRRIGGRGVEGLPLPWTFVHPTAQVTSGRKGEHLSIRGAWQSPGKELATGAFLMCHPNMGMGFFDPRVESGWSSCSKPLPSRSSLLAPLLFRQLFCQLFNLCICNP